MNEEITFLKILTSKRQYPDRDEMIGSDESKMKYTSGLIYNSKINELIEDSDDYYEESKEYIITNSYSTLYFKASNEHANCDVPTIEKLMLDDYF